MSVTSQPECSALDAALRIAVNAHAGQRDKIGQPYILHPIRVMLAMSTDAERTAAVLHDVVEDSAVTIDDLRREGFSEDVVHAVDAMTRRGGEGYEEYVERASRDPLARRIKIADLDDNMNLRRLHGLEDQDRERMERYRKAYRFLARRESPHA